jgi:anti-sigma factor RsiW
MRLLLSRHSVRVLLMPIRHLSPDEIAAFIDGTISRTDRATTELHLSGCPECRAELTSCARIASTAPRRAPPDQRWAWLGVVVAAGLVGILLRPRPHVVDPEAAMQRGTDATGVTVTPFAPADDSLVPRAGLRFVWSSEGSQTSYRVVVTDKSGTPAWRKDVPDTSVDVPASARLIVGERYFWRVEALHADGRVSRTRQMSFRVLP